MAGMPRALRHRCCRGDTPYYMAIGHCLRERLLRIYAISGGQLPAGVKVMVYRRCYHWRLLVVTSSITYWLRRVTRPQRRLAWSLRWSGPPVGHGYDGEHWRVGVRASASQASTRR